MSQGYQMYPPKCYKTPEHLFRLSPRQTLFRSCRGLFRGTFCNFVANLRWHKPIKTETLTEKKNETD
jgi:hypothetical protein